MVTQNLKAIAVNASVAVGGTAVLAAVVAGAVASGHPTAPSPTAPVPYERYCADAVAQVRVSDDICSGQEPSDEPLFVWLYLPTGALLPSVGAADSDSTPVAALPSGAVLVSTTPTEATR